LEDGWGVIVADLTTLTADLERLKKARRSGVLRILLADREVTYRNDQELARQIAALEAEIAALQGASKPRTVAVRSEKGWL
jgi:hypothetical protein